MTTGNILHESSSAPRQHKSVQYKWFTLYLHQNGSHTDMLQLHFISCRGVPGAGGNMRVSRDFCQSYLVFNLFYSLQRGFNGFIAEKNYTYTLQSIQRGSIISQRGGGVKLFPGGGGGPNANFFRNPCTYLLFSREGPLSPSGSAHGQCHHNGTIFITVPLLTIIVRH